MAKLRDSYKEWKFFRQDPEKTKKKKKPRFSVAMARQSIKGALEKSEKEPKDDGPTDSVFHCYGIKQSPGPPPKKLTKKDELARKLYFQSTGKQMPKPRKEHIAEVKAHCLTDGDLPVQFDLIMSPFGFVVVDVNSKLEIRRW